ncbi:MAG: cysteine desulfurase-like protein [Acidimicrobiia bacterium]
MFDINQVRSAFPALNRLDNGRPAAYLDGPGGTQVPHSVIEAMRRVLVEGVSNLGGGFPPSAAGENITSQARSAMADLFNSDPGEVVFGQNMTSLTFALSRALAASWSENDAIVLTSLDHDANYTPWVLAAEERGVEVRVADFDIESGLLDPDSVIDLIDDRVRLVAVAFSSNAIGTKVDIPPISAAAHQVGALVFVDAVHAGPHHLIDVKDLDCDFLAVSVYKFFGPHIGVLYGRADLLASTSAFKVRPAPSDPPGKWETGTQSFESLAGVTAAVDHIASLGSDGATRRGSLEMAFAEIDLYEKTLGQRFLDGIDRLEKVSLHGVRGLQSRGPTFAISVAGAGADRVASHLTDLGIYVWTGHFYAVNVMKRLGHLEDGGLVRIGFVHYNTSGEIDRLLEGLAEV